MLSTTMTRAATMRSVWWAGERRTAQSTGETVNLPALLGAHPACTAPLTVGATVRNLANTRGGSA